MRYLITTADDCGLSEGINSATARLHEKGLITAASIMTNLEATDHALDLLARYPSLDVGVHLNLTDGFPLTDVKMSSGLIHRSGRFRGWQALFSNAVTARPSFLKSVRAELAAQIEAFLKSGHKPRHLTTHIHFHWFPSLQNIVCELAHDYDIEWVRNRNLARTVVPRNPLLSTTLHGTNGTDSFCEVTVPDYVIGLQFWMRYGSTAQLLRRLLQLDGSLELVVHPSLEQDPALPKSMSYQPAARFLEMHYFEQFIVLLQHEMPDGFRLTTMREIG